MATKQINFRIDADLEAQIREIATAQGMKVGEWLQKVAKQTLEYEEEPITSDGDSDSNSSNGSNNQDIIDRVNELEEEITQSACETEERFNSCHNRLIEQEEEIKSLQDRLQALEASYQGTASTDSKSNTSDSKLLSGTALGKRLGVGESTVRGHAGKGEKHFKQWSKRRDPEGLAWNRNPQTKKYQVVEGDQSDYKASHMPSDDEHQISNGDKSPNGHQENAPFVEQLEKYPTQTP